eukprot:CAMPEP_0114565038 /NCGR_PEP_ID=MMETSP0114-20121206/14076_1 /TAXON_ID=31324 /ORGANISM="Goniomonas sp, Strain m" /LENGTH=117 /DNA_ID=CAMNT_0001751217 /DNA_START=11 /DNA_END=363 /DNA_ORIENTATION=+
MAVPDSEPMPDSAILGPFAVVQDSALWHPVEPQDGARRTPKGLTPQDGARLTPKGLTPQNRARLTPQYSARLTPKGSAGLAPRLAHLAAAAATTRQVASQDMQNMAHVRCDLPPPLP